MAGSREEKKKALARRRSKETSPLPGPGLPLGEGKSGRWALAIAGALLIALLAYVTGIRMGKTLTEIRQPEGTGSKRESKEISETPFRFHVLEEPSKSARESLHPKPGSQEAPKGKAGKEEAGRAEGKIDEKKAGRSQGNTVAPDSSERKEASSSPAKYAIQVGAFNNSQEAQEMVKKLKSKGYEAYSVTGSAAAKGTWHRVRIGRFQSLQEARQFTLTFEKKEKIKTIITPISPP